jgi:hypothetical protein
MSRRMTNHASSDATGRTHSVKLGRDRGHDHVGCAFCDHESCFLDNLMGAAYVIHHMVTAHWDVLERIRAAIVSDSANSEHQLLAFIAAKRAERPGDV